MMILLLLHSYCNFRLLKLRLSRMRSSFNWSSAHSEHMLQDGEQEGRSLAPSLFQFKLMKMALYCEEEQDYWEDQDFSRY